MDALCSQVLTSWLQTPGASVLRMGDENCLMRITLRYYVWKKSTV
jgi:hypothetical protein